MTERWLTRRKFIEVVGAAVPTAAVLSASPANAAADDASGILEIDPTPQFALSPYLYMQSSIARIPPGHGPA